MNFRTILKMSKLEAALANSAANRAALRTLYRRLRRHGEEESMIRHGLATASLEENVKTATNLLRLHTRALSLLQARKHTLFFNIPARIVNGVQRKIVYYRLLAIRLNHRSWAATKEVITTCVFFLLCFLFYQMYAVCRVGLDQADEKYRLLAIPVLQTLEALEMAERSKENRKSEMESDMQFERNFLKQAPAKGADLAK